MRFLNINGVIKKSGLNQKKLAIYCGCSEMWLSNMKKPENYTKTLKLIDKLLEVSGMTYEQLRSIDKTTEWIESVISSCTTPEQLEAALKLKENYNNQNK